MSSTRDCSSSVCQSFCQINIHGCNQKGMLSGDLRVVEVRGGPVVTSVWQPSKSVVSRMTDFGYYILTFPQASSSLTRHILQRAKMMLWLRLSTSLLKRFDLPRCTFINWTSIYYLGKSM